MSLRFCNEILEAHTPLHGLRLNSFYDNIKDTIWEVYIMLESGDDPLCRLATGVCIDRRGLIITSSFRVNGNAIEVCNTNSGDTFTAARVGSVGDEYGLTLLQISGADDYAEFDFASIVDDTNLFAGRDVYTIAHVGADELNRCLLMCGRAVSRLRRKDELWARIPELNDFLGKIGGDVQLLLVYGFESEVHNAKVSEEFQVPLNCADCLESLGAPVFNSKGQVIGVIIACDGGLEYAVPSSCVLRIMENVPDPKHDKSSSNLLTR